MTAKEKALSMELLEAKRKQFGDYQQGIRQKSVQEDGAMTNQVLSEVNAFIGEYGRKKGYTIILGATQMGNLVYASDRLDITDELQDALEKNYNGL